MSESLFNTLYTMACDQLEKKTMDSLAEAETMFNVLTLYFPGNVLTWVGMGCMVSAKYGDPIAEKMYIQVGPGVSHPVFHLYSAECMARLGHVSQARETLNFGKSFLANVHAPALTDAYKALEKTLTNNGRGLK